MKSKELAKALRLEGLSYRKIAGRLGVSSTAVRYWLNLSVREAHKQYHLQNREKILAEQKKYWADNKQHISIRNKEWRQANRQKVSEYNKQYNLEHRERIQNRRNKRHVERRKTDQNYRIACNLRTRLSKALKHQYKSGSAVDDLGCSIDDLKKRLEFLFEPGMTWDNYGQWHIDHTSPLASFDLTDRAQFLQACNFTNLQPLWAEDNLSKGSTVPD